MQEKSILYVRLGVWWFGVFFKDLEHFFHAKRDSLTELRTLSFIGMGHEQYQVECLKCTFLFLFFLLSDTRIICTVLGNEIGEVITVCALIHNGQEKVLLS